MVQNSWSTILKWKKINDEINHLDLAKLCLKIAKNQLLPTMAFWRRPLISHFKFLGPNDNFGNIG